MFLVLHMMRRYVKCETTVTVSTMMMAAAMRFMYSRTLLVNRNASPCKHAHHSACFMDALYINPLND